MVKEYQNYSSRTKGVAMIVESRISMRCEFRSVARKLTTFFVNRSMEDHKIVNALRASIIHKREWLYAYRPWGFMRSRGVCARNRLCLVSLIGARFRKA